MKTKTEVLQNLFLAIGAYNDRITAERKALLAKKYRTLQVVSK